MAQVKLSYKNRGGSFLRRSGARRSRKLLRLYTQRRRYKTDLLKRKPYYMMPREYTTFEREQLRDFEKQLYKEILSKEEE